MTLFVIARSRTTKQSLILLRDYHGPAALAMTACGLMRRRCTLPHSDTVEGLLRRSRWLLLATTSVSGQDCRGRLATLYRTIQPVTLTI